MGQIIEYAGGIRDDLLAERAPIEGIEPGATLVVGKSQVAVAQLGAEEFRTYPEGRHTLPADVPGSAAIWFAWPERLHVVDYEATPSVPIHFADVGAAQVRLTASFSYRVGHPEILVRQLGGERTAITRSDVESFQTDSVAAALFQTLTQSRFALHELAKSYEDIGARIRDGAQGKFEVRGLKLEDVSFTGARPVEGDEAAAGAGAGTAGKPVAYEMLWDCGFCGAKALLGKTHRHCPGCGAPQDPAKRYFPKPGEEVVAENHEYAGADRHCPACDSPCSAKANNCANCGSSLEGAEHVALKSEPTGPPARPPAAGPPAKGGTRRRSFLGAGCLVALLGLVGFIASLLWTKPVRATVERLSWSREIDVEQFRPVTDTKWCDEMPAGAYDVSRSREVRDHDKVADGEDCTTRRVDQGDGTFVEQQDCTTRYRDEPVYDERCRFSVDRWEKVRTAKVAGDSAQSPAWPALDLAQTGDCRGCEREGARRETYRIHIAADGHESACSVKADAWRQYHAGQTLTLRQRVVSGGIACDSLP